MRTALYLLAALVVLVLTILVVAPAQWLAGAVQAAISRQREYLADASAVQFIRQIAGIAGALKKIGGLQAGSNLKSPKAEEIARHDPALHH